MEHECNHLTKYNEANKGITSMYIAYDTTNKQWDLDIDHERGHGYHAIDINIIIYPITHCPFCGQKLEVE